MKMLAYWKYFMYVCEHKKNVFIECMKEGLYLRAFTHDLSKFRPSEFFPYARYFYIDKNSIDNAVAFEDAWELHYKRNSHHPEHHLMFHRVEDGKIVESMYKEMPLDDIREMICDLKAMSRKFGGSAQEYYLKNYHKFEFNRLTRADIDFMLGLTKNISKQSFLSLYDLVNHYDKAEFNRLFKDVVDRYPNIDIYDSLKNRKE